MSGWIKFDKDMANDPRLLQAASILLDDYLIAHRTPGGGDDLSHCDASRFVTHVLRGALVTLWCYADEHIRDDDSLPCDADAVDALVGIEGFCDLMPVEWLQISEDGNHVILPGYCKKNALIAKRKSAISGAERTRRWRKKIREQAAAERSAQRDAQGDASQASSQRRHRDVTVTADQDQDQDLRNTHTQGAGKETEARQEISAAAALAIPLRKAGVQITSMHPLCIAWSKEFTVEQAMQAVAVARQNIVEPEAIPAKYLDKVLRNPPRPSASRNGKAHASTPAAPRPKSPVELANEALERAVRDGKTDAQILRELGDQGVDIGWIRIKREECAA